VSEPPEPLLESPAPDRGRGLLPVLPLPVLPLPVLPLPVLPLPVLPLPDPEDELPFEDPLLEPFDDPLLEPFDDPLLDPLLDEPLEPEPAASWRPAEVRTGAARLPATTARNATSATQPLARTAEG
jgi:hypothetical protein